MQLRTAAAVVGLLVLMVGVVALGIGVTGGSLEERWVSETPRDNERNHHPVGASPNGSVVVAPIAEVPGEGVTIAPEDCSLVRLEPDDGGIRWRVTVPPDRCFTHALTQPDVADLDGDGSLEVAVMSTENALVVYDADDGNERWRVDVPTYGYGRPTVADLRPAPGREVVATDIDGDVVAASANGSVAWRIALEGTVWDRVSVYEAPIVDDVDGDGEADVLVGTDAGPALLDADGQVRWHRNGTATYVTAARLDGGSSMTVFTSGHGGIRAYDGDDGDLLWERELNARIRTTATVDGEPTLFAGVYGGEVVALDAATGETTWSTEVASGDHRVPPPVAADVTGDGAPEVVAVAEDGTVAVLDAPSGAELAAYERAVPIWTFATAADLDGDGGAEILVVYGDGRVVALEYTPSDLPGFIGR